MQSDNFNLGTLTPTRPVINFKVVFIAFFGKPAADWSHFAWSVLVNGIPFEYKTGIGHATPIYKKAGQWGGLGRNKKPENSLLNQDLETWVHIPKQDEVLKCLFSDAECAALTFSEFCADLGYDNDSIKALKTYAACQETLDRLKKAFGPKYNELRDYYNNLDL